MLKPLRPLLTDRRRGRAVAAASVTLAAAGIALPRALQPVPYTHLTLPANREG